MFVFSVLWPEASVKSATGFSLPGLPASQVNHPAPVTSILVGYSSLQENHYDTEGSCTDSLAFLPHSFLSIYFPSLVFHVLDPVCFQRPPGMTGLSCLVSSFIVPSSSKTPMHLCFPWCKPGTFVLSVSSRTLRLI